MTDLAPATEEVTPEQHKRLRWALVLISLAQLMVVLDSTIANIALPYIGTDLDIDQANLSWIVTGYALTFGGFLLLGGRLADLYGRRLIFIVGVLVFAVASLVGGFAQNEFMLLSARGLQGLGAAMASPAAYLAMFAASPASLSRPESYKAAAFWVISRASSISMWIFASGCARPWCEPIGCSHT
jgi:MFS family permease